MVSYMVMLSAFTTTLLLAATASADTPAYVTRFADRAEVLAAWTPQSECAHCGKSDGGGFGGTGKDECTNMTLAATSFGSSGMTHTTRALPAATPTLCRTESQVCSSGHMTWDPNLLYGNFSVVARWFVGSSLETSTGFIGLDSPKNEASITMGFHGPGWLGGYGENNHRYQHGIYAHVKDGHNREYTNTTADMSASFHRYGLLWTPTLVEWRFDGAVVRRVTDTSIIPQIKMQLRLHTRSGYCDKMAVGASFNATFSEFSYQPVAHAPPGPSPPGPSPPGPSPPSPAPATECAKAGGILAAKGKDAGKACCAKSCGVCGGTDCGSHPGGHAACCTKQIVAAGKSCSVQKAPCTV